MGEGIKLRKWVYGVVVGQIVLALAAPVSVEGEGTITVICDRPGRMLCLYEVEEQEYITDGITSDKNEIEGDEYNIQNVLDMRDRVKPIQYALAVKGGKATFSGLNQGVYLVFDEEFEENPSKAGYAPFLVEVPERKRDGSLDWTVERKETAK